MALPQDKLDLNKGLDFSSILVLTICDWLSYTRKTEEVRNHMCRSGHMRGHSGSEVGRIIGWGLGFRGFWTFWSHYPG